MDTKRLYVDFHVLQTVPPSCVNRDDTGSPKTAVYGGAVRARVSSQAWKHAMRVMFTGEMSDAVETGKRTKKGTDLVAKQITLLAPESDAEKLAKKAIRMLVFSPYPIQMSNMGAMATIGMLLNITNSGMTAFWMVFDQPLRMPMRVPPTAVKRNPSTNSYKVTEMFFCQ